MKNAAVIIPTYNERDNIAGLIGLIRKNLECKIIVVDDNSPDGTGALVDSLKETDTALEIIHRAQKLGLASAYKEGISYAPSHNYDPIIQMD